MLCLCQDAKLPQLLVQLVHVCLDARLDRSEVMVVQFLAFRRLCPEKCSPRIDKVSSLFKHLLVNQEIFLLRSDGGCHMLDVLVAEQLQHSQCLPVDRVH